MTRDVTFAGSSVRVEYTGREAARIVEFLLARLPPADGPPSHATLTLHAEQPGGDYTVHAGDTRLYHGGSAGAAGRELLERLLYHLSDRSRDGLVLHAAALGRDGECLLLPGRTGRGKTTLAAWLSGHGFEYLTDELVFIPSGSTDVIPFPRPLNVRMASLPVLGWRAPTADSSRALVTADMALVWPETPSPAAPPGAVRLARIVFPRYQARRTFQPKALSKAEAGLGLMSCLVNARNLDDHGFAEVTRLAQQIPAYQVGYSDVLEITEWLKGGAP